MAMLFFQENKNLNFKTQVTESGHHLKIVTKYIPLSISIDQLVGYALGSKKEIYPRDGEKSNHHQHQMVPPRNVWGFGSFNWTSRKGDACVWTEWFDHNTPCYGKVDISKTR